MAEEIKYARKCDCCGKGMNEGYHDAGDYYCSDRCLIWGNTTEGLGALGDEQDQSKPYTMQDWENDCKESEDECYYTEWGEDQGNFEDGHYLANGTFVSELN